MTENFGPCYVHVSTIGNQTWDIRVPQFPGIENNKDNFKMKICYMFKKITVNSAILLIENS
jgi:hypothetical protein